MGTEKKLGKKEVITLESFRKILRIIRNEAAETMKAPSHPGFQLAHLEQILGGVAGGVDLVIFGVQKIIVGFDFESGSYRYILASEVLKLLNVSMQTFIQCFLACGF